MLNYRRMTRRHFLSAAGVAAVAAAGGVIVLRNSQSAQMASPSLTLTHKSFLHLWEVEPPELKSVKPGDSPTLQVFLPKAGQATGAAYIVCPGGGYVTLAPNEGAPVAQWLADNGITAFVLSYRHAFRYAHPFPFQDALRAVRFVRAHAQKWGLNPERLGMLGFSAGGHLTSMVATHPDPGQAQAKDPVERVSSHLNAHVLVYPVISEEAGESIWQNILGKHPDPKLIELFCSDKHVTAQTPPAFLVHSTQDTGVLAKHSDLYAAALKSAGVPYTYIRGPLGQHGFGLTDGWAPQCVEWLRGMGWASSTP